MDALFLLGLVALAVVWVWASLPTRRAAEDADLVERLMELVRQERQL